MKEQLLLLLCLFVATKADFGPLFDNLTFADEINEESDPVKLVTKVKGPIVAYLQSGDMADVERECQDSEYGQEMRRTMEDIDKDPLANHVSNFLDRSLKKISPADKKMEKAFNQEFTLKSLGAEKHMGLYFQLEENLVSLMRYYLKKRAADAQDFRRFHRGIPLQEVARAIARAKEAMLQYERVLDATNTDMTCKEILEPVKK